MKKKKIWCSEEGNITPLTIALLLIVLLIICSIAEVVRIGIIVQGVRDGLQQASIAVATANWDEVYNGLREGYAGGYTFVGEEWEENLEEEDIYATLDQVLGTREEEDGHKKAVSENQYEYILSDLETEILNVSFGSNVAKESFTVKASIKIEIPFSFGFQRLPPFEMTIRTNAIYMPKF